MTEAQAVALVKALMGGMSKPKSKKAKPSPKTDKAGWLAAKDAKTIKGFAQKGIVDVVLMDRNDRSKPFNVRSFKGWVENGRIVRKGENGVNGLFHESQTEELTESVAA